MGSATPPAISVHARESMQAVPSSALVLVPWSACAALSVNWGERTNDARCAVVAGSEPMSNR
jgi:hypothetical protein